MKLDFINKENLKIARENIGFSLEEVQQIFNKNKNDTIKRFESGEEIPTYSQLKKLSTIYNIASILLLSENNIKILENKPKDFRKINEKNNPKLKDLIYKMIIKQKNIERILKENETKENENKNHIIGVGNNISKPKEMADFIIEKLKINIKEFRQQKDYNEAFKYLINKIEEHNIFVFKTYSSQVEQKRGDKITGISVQDMRGLSLYNEYAPFIVIHRQDAPTAKIFTLLHELTHIFRKTSGISNIQEFSIDFRDGEYDKEEYFCNQVAAEILLSNMEFTSVKSKEEINLLSKELKVSKMTLFIKLKKLNKINGDIEKIEKEIRNPDFVSKNKKDDGGNFYNSQKDSNSSSYTKIIHNAYLEENLSAVEVYNLLGLTPDKI